MAATLAESTPNKRGYGCTAMDDVLAMDADGGNPLLSLTLNSPMQNLHDQA